MNRRFSKEDMQMATVTQTRRTDNSRCRGYGEASASPLWHGKQAAAVGMGGWFLRQSVASHRAPLLLGVHPRGEDGRPHRYLYTNAHGSFTVARRWKQVKRRPSVDGETKSGPSTQRKTPQPLKSGTPALATTRMSRDAVLRSLSPRRRGGRACVGGGQCLRSLQGGQH